MTGIIKTDQLQGAQSSTIAIPSGNNLTVGGTLGVTGVLTGTSLDISGNIDIDGTSNLDVVDIDGAVNMASTLIVSGTTTIQKASSGGTANSSAALVIEGTDATKAHIQLLCDNSDVQSIYFGDAADNDIGKIAYDHTGNTMRFNVNAAERIRIDAAGNIFIGNTAEFVDGTGTGDKGIQLNPIGMVVATRNGGISGIFGRQASDGTIIQLRKDGSSIASIGSDGSDLFIESSVSNHAGLRFAGGSVLPRYNGSLADNAVDLGQASTDYRFKDIYLSGGVRVGGTGTANLLDDYEEGTFTPILHGTSNYNEPTYASRAGAYTKIGRLVNITLHVQISNKQNVNGNIVIGSFPFTIGNTLSTTGIDHAGVTSYYSSLADNVSNIRVGGVGSTNYCYIYSTPGTQSTGTSPINHNGISDTFDIRISMTYFT